METRACVVGGGPAGMVLGLLLARQGVQTVVLEKHETFLRDFRGDTVHPSTLTLMDELGLGERLHAAFTVAADGRHSTVREKLGLRPKEFGAPMDVLWFRLPRRDTDPRARWAIPDPGGSWSASTGATTGRSRT